MKAISIREAEGQLGQLVAEACRGETIVMTEINLQSPMSAVLDNFPVRNGALFRRYH